MDHEKFKNVASGIQSVVIAAAVIVGGIWTLYTFTSLNQAEAAKKQLEEIEQRLRTHANIEITIRPEQLNGVVDQTALILAHVDIKNIGSRPTDLLFDPDGPLTATLVKPRDDGTFSFGEIRRAKQYMNSGTPSVNQGTVMRPNGAHTIDYIIPVNAKGLYLLTFSVDLQPSELEMSLQAGMPPTHKAYWSSQAYFNVK